MHRQTFLSDAFGEFAGLSNREFLLFALFAIVSALTEILHWSLGTTRVTPYDYAGIAVAAAAWLAVTYVSSMSLVGRQSNLASFSRFAVTSLVVLAPVVAGVVVFAALVPGPYENLGLGVGFSLLLIGMIVLTLLPALPVAQALSIKFVSPLRLARRTKGHRWQLLLALFVSGSINRLSPDTSAARDYWDAILSALGSGLMTSITSLIAMSIGVTAWRYAVRNDPSLYGDEPRGSGA